MVDRNEYAEKLFLYTSVGVCGHIHVKIDRSHEFYNRLVLSLESSIKK
jgi:hypothetical protein